MSPESRFGTKRSPYSFSLSLRLFLRVLGGDSSGVVSLVVERVLSKEGVEAAKRGMILGRFLR